MQPQGTDLSVSAGECALQSSKLHIWVMHCIIRGNCVQFSQELDSYQVLVWGEGKRILKQQGRSVLWDKNHHMLSFSFATS